jgi:exodeoxyribonuclease VII small subunit
MAKSKAKQPIEDWNYEATVDRVEDILNAIEGGELELTEVFSQFAIGVDCLNQCESFLTQQQEQVELLLETLGDNAPMSEWNVGKVSPRPPLI